MFFLMLLVIIKYILDRPNDNGWKEGISPNLEFSKTSADFLINSNVQNKNKF